MKRDITEELIDALCNLVQSGVDGRKFEVHQALCELRALAKRAVRQRDSVCSSVTNAMANASWAVSSAIINAISMPETDTPTPSLTVIDGGKNATR